jgi:hypothetical protein
LVPCIGEEEAKYIQLIRGFDNPTDIQSWRSFCSQHSNKKVRGMLFSLLCVSTVEIPPDWYKHKAQYPWLLPAFNKSLSRFPPGYWEMSPNHSNLVESGHVETNANTGIGLSPVEAIEKYVHVVSFCFCFCFLILECRARSHDAEVADSLLATDSTGILRNQNNTDKARMRRAFGLQNAVNKKKKVHGELDNKITDIREHLDSVSQTKKDLQQQLKDLNTEKKDQGRSPRKGRKLDDVTNLPQILGRRVLPDSSTGTLTVNL